MKFSVPLVALALVVMSGCNTATSSIRVPRIGVQAQELDRSEYVVLGNAEGNACAEQSCFLGLFCSVKDESGNAIKVMDPDTGLELLGAGLGTPDDVAAVAEDRALFSALKTQTDADAVFSPRKTMELETKSAIINSSIKACVRVFGKSIRIKTDEEMKGGVAAAPPPPPPPAETPPPPPPAAPPAG